MSGRESLCVAVASAALVVIGCSKSAESRPDTAAAPAAVGGVNANPVDTGMAATTRDSAGMGRDTSHALPKDSMRNAP
jgi:hypothetical protein